MAESDRVEDLLRSVERNVQAVAEVNRAVARLLDEAPSVEAKEFSIIRYLSYTLIWKNKSSGVALRKVPILGHFIGLS